MEENFDKILQAVPEAIIVVNNSHQVQFMNFAAIALFEVTDISSVIGNSFSLLPGGDGLKSYEQRIEFTKKVNEFALNKAPRPEPDDEQVWITGGLNNRLFYFRAVPLSAERNNKFGYVIRVDDVTAKQAATSYLAGLPSDMRVPMTTIRGYTELLLREDLSPNLTEEQRQWISIIQSNGKKLEDLRGDIINYNKAIAR